MLEEIVVTAEKREADLQKTSMSIQVFTGEQLRAEGKRRIVMLLVPGQSLPHQVESFQGVRSPGWPSENGNVTPDGIGVVGGPPGGPPPGGPDGMGDGPGGPGGAMGPMAEPGVVMSLTNGDYQGDIHNGTGYYMQGAVPLEVTIGEGASLTGAISLTETRHVDENGAQNTHFTINEYYYLGHVENRNYRNGYSEVDVILEDGGVWTVTGESYLSSLAVNSGSVLGADGRDVIMTVDGIATVIETDGSYEGDVVISLVN